MTDILTSMKQRTSELNENIRQRIELDMIKIESKALREMTPYLAQKSYRNVMIAADRTTYPVAGENLRDALSKGGMNVFISIVEPNLVGDVLADEASLIQLLLDIQQAKVQVVIAVGGGTIHDIVRYCAYTAQIPFVSVPTAPSVDGFTSKGAPIITRGEKITIPAIGPSAIFADIDILSQAPPALVAAGFGDMLGKYTSLFDWKFGALTAGEPYLQAAADITQSALLRCVKQVDHIARRDEEGIHTLITSLIESGLAMLLFGQSHPASGAEHHVSHYWEMAYIRLGKNQLLHGAKVGVACMEMSKLYHRIASNGVEEWESSSPIRNHWAEISSLIEQIPDEMMLKDLLRQVGGPISIQELNVEKELLDSSLREAHLVRHNRSTLLRAYNEKTTGRTHNC